MTYMLPQSGTPWLDPCGDPYAGARMFIFDSGTSTPKSVYRDADLSIPHDHPIVANGSGMFPAVFLSGGDYSLRIEDAGAVAIWGTVDGISIPNIGDGGGGGGGDTPVELLFRTGDYKDRHGTGAHSGWVRANGLTLGSGSSGATERANADCLDLFTYLWNADPTLAVSGGRGANAASDWAANKAIALPDMRLRARIGMASMGATTSTLIPAASFDNSEDGDDLGATVGAGSVTLTVGQMPAHAHPGSSTSTDGSHSHTYGGQPGGGGVALGNGVQDITTGSTSTAGSHSHTVNVASQGSGQAHPNVQPSAVVTVYIKL